MRNIFESVSASPRLRRFSASYMMLYFIIMLVVNLLIKLLPVINAFPIVYAKDFIVYFVEGALLYGLISGIAEKDYRLSRSLSSFSNSKNYPYYLVYTAVNTVYSALFGLVSLATAEGSAISSLGWALTVIINIVRLLLNFALVRLFFERILFKKEKLDLAYVCRACFDTVKNKPLRIVAAEVMMLLVKYASVFFGTLLVMFLTSMIGTHWAVSFAGSTLVSIQFGALIYSWPVYYLYYKETCEE